MNNYTIEKRGTIQRENTTAIAEYFIKFKKPWTIAEISEILNSYFKINDLIFYEDIRWHAVDDYTVQVTRYSGGLIF